MMLHLYVKESTADLITKIEEAQSKQAIDEISCLDHLGGFDANFKNTILDIIQEFSCKQNNKITVTNSYIFDDRVLKNYPNLHFKFHLFEPLTHFERYTQHPALTYQNFVCSFNGTQHVGRKLLTAALKKFDIFNPEFCSKNIKFSRDQLDGHLCDLVGQKEIFYRKFFIGDDSENFFQCVNNLGPIGFDQIRHLQAFDHVKNLQNLESKITSSFLHIVSESLATSNYPFVTEKFFYSIVTRGLFLAYAQPNWHAYIEKYFGFKPYKVLFDYKFDQVTNPVERLIEMMCMISKFKRLSSDDWQELYQLEGDTIEYNYDHYFSKNYLKYLAKYSEQVYN